MVLYAVLVTIIVLLLLSFKGPLELGYLKDIGIDLVGSFEAAAKTSTWEATLKGGTLALILIVQPVVFGVLFIRLIDMLFRFSVIAKLEKRGFLKLEGRSRGKTPKSKVDLKEMVSVLEPYSPPVATGLGPTVALSLDHAGSMGKYEGFAGRLLPFLLFRGSPAQLILASLSLAGVCLSFLLLEIGWITVAMFVLLICLYGPSSFLYFSVLSRYTIDTEIQMRSKIMEQGFFYKFLVKLKRERFLYYTNGLRGVAVTALYQVTAMIASISGIIKIMSFPKLRASFFKEKAEMENRYEMANLPSLAAILEVVAEERDGHFSFRSHPWIYKMLDKGRIFRLPSRVTLIF